MSRDAIVAPCLGKALACGIRDPPASPVYIYFRAHLQSGSCFSRLSMNAIPPSRHIRDACHFQCNNQQAQRQDAKVRTDDKGAVGSFVGGSWLYVFFSFYS